MSISFRIALGFAIAMLAGCGASSPPPSVVSNPDDYRMPPPYDGPSRELLARGEALPKLECAGWFHGEPKPFGPDGPAVHVVDIWAQWCPECQNLAENMTALRAKYRTASVQFLSVTNLAKTPTDLFVRGNGYDWPCGYGLKTEAIVDLGAVNSGMAARMGAYAIAPTIYVVDRTGKVISSDGRARWRHLPKEEILALVTKLIDEALAQSEARPSPIPN